MASCSLDTSNVFSLLALPFPTRKLLTRAVYRAEPSCQLLRAFVNQALSDSPQGYIDVLRDGLLNSTEGTGPSKEIKRLRSRDTLRKYPKEDLIGKVVLVRLDLSACRIEGDKLDTEAIATAVPTLSYLISSDAKIVIASHWSALESSKKAGMNKLIADSLSQHLGTIVWTINAATGPAVQEAIVTMSIGDILLLGNLHQYREELSNDRVFSKELASNIDIFVNDAFPISHRILASTVGVACFTRARLAGFQLERELFFLTKATRNLDHPFVAIVGGAQLSQALVLLYEMLRTCSSVVITGSMIFTFFEALGYGCSSSFSQNFMVADALNFLTAAAAKHVNIILPIDLICSKDGGSLTTFKPNCVPEGWVPVSVGEDTLRLIESALLPSKMALWIGPFSISKTVDNPHVIKSIAKIFVDISRRGCTTILSCRQAISAIRNEEQSREVSHISTGSAALMEFLKGRNLPAVSSLDFACPSEPEWRAIYKDPNLPLVIDVGCGNGLFIFRMARDHPRTLNFLGLEVRKKLVDRCLMSVTEANLCNLHFVEADAATMFKRIVSNYPGKVVLVTIQCPVPNFTDAETRRRMVQKQLVEQILHSLSVNSKIFLQSDVKSVAMQLRKDFLQQGKGCLHLSSEHQDAAKCDTDGWLLRNPFAVSSDWEDHVLQRGDRMYRVLLSCFSECHRRHDFNL